MADGMFTAIWRPPFSMDAAELREWPAGTTITEMVAGFGPALPKDFDRRGEIVLAGRDGEEHVLARRYWSGTAIKAGQKLTLHYAPGRSGNAGKNAVLGLVIAVASALTAGAALAAAGPFSFLTAGSLTARLLAGGITIAGSLLNNALTAPPVATAQNSSTDTLSGPASVAGNVIGRGVPVPAVIGERDIYPPFVTQPLTERVGEEEVVEVVMALAGTYAISMPRAGESSVAEADDVTLQIREGQPGDLPITLIERYGATSLVNTEIAPHKTDPDDPEELENQTNPDASLPTWLGMGTAGEWDECWLHLTLPGGLAKPSAEGQIQAVPFRMRMRQDDADDWIHLPELHFAGSEVREIRPTIKLLRGDVPETVPSMPSNRGWRAVYAAAPGQDAPNPVTGGWTAHSSFVDGAGSNALYSGVEGSSNVVRVTVSGTEATLTLDPVVFAEGRWQIEIKRGACYDVSDFSRADYEYNGYVIDFFHYVETGGVFEVARTRDGLSDGCYLTRCCSVVNSHPVNGGKPVSDMTLIAARFFGRSVSSFKVRASSIVDRWDGAAFADVGESALPADHYHNVLRGPLASLPLPAELFDMTGVAAWRAANVTEDRRCDMIVEGALVAEVLANIAGCAFARPLASEIWGVMRDYDRSAEDPAQVFNMHNSWSLKMSRSFERLPDMLRCAFTDTEGRQREIEVWRDGREGVAKPLIETMTYVGLVRAADVRERARHDLRQLEERAATYSFNAFAETIRCRRGDLIAVNHPVLNKTHDSARVRAITIETVEEEDLMTSVSLDSLVRIYNEDDMHEVADMHAVTDMHTVGLKSSLRIRRSDGNFSVHPVSNATGQTGTLTLTTPAALPEYEEGGQTVRAVRRGNLVWVGSTGREERRLIATDITWQKNWQARISALAEAPVLFA